MNERIKELALTIPALVSWGIDNDDNFSEAVEELAKLIIKECVRLTYGFEHPRYDKTGGHIITDHFGMSDD